MRVIGYIFFILSFPLLASTEITTSIYDIDFGQKSNDEVLFLLGNGQVAKLRNTDSFTQSKMNLTKYKKRLFSITMDDDRFITRIVPVQNLSPFSQPDSKRQNSIDEYVPTTIASMEVAKRYFREARYNPKDSQCFNRAIVWGYEWWRLHSLKSNKMLIYFTRTYIRRYNFEWWFHIAPLVHIMDNGKVVERMMDIKYSSGPLPIGKWTNLFMRNDVPCRVITKYSDYADYPYTGECYIQRTNMYTYQPADLQMNEAWGYTKEKFVMDEVRAAYLEAYDEQI